MKKSKIKKTKKVKFPLSKMRKKDKDYVAILLEEMRSDFTVFGETLGGFGDKLELVKQELELVKQKGDATFEEVGRIKVEITGIKGEMVGMKIQEFRAPFFD